MRRLAILLIVGILWLGGLHLSFAVADEHSVTDHGQTESICSGKQSTDGCLIHGNQLETACFTFNNFEPPVTKTINCHSNFLSLLRNSQLGRKSSEIGLIDRIKLTGTVIKRE